MKRITISLPEELGAAVEREARRRRISVSRVIRERIEGSAISGGTRRIPFAAIGRSGRRDTARQSEAILEREWAKGSSHARGR